MSDASTTNSKTALEPVKVVRELQSTGTMLVRAGTRTIVNAATQRDLQEEGVMLAGILDLNAFDWARIVFEVTVDLLNTKNNGFFDEELSTLGPISYQLLDGACDGFTALEAYWSVRDSINAMVAARCSGASTSLGWMGTVDNKAQISMSSTSVKLSDKDQFSNLSRVVSPDDMRGQVGAIIQTMDLFDWNSAIIINTDTPYAKDLATSYRENWNGDVPYVATVQLNNDGSIDENSVYRALKEAPHDDPANNSKVVILIAHSQHAFPILKMAKDIFPKETFFMGPQAWVGRTPDGDTDWIRKVPGWLGVVPYRNRDRHYEKFIDLGGDRLKPILDANGELPDYAAEYTVDSIIAMAVALARTPVNLRRDGARISKELRSLEFAGVSGFVSFTEEGDRKNPQFSILNYQQTDNGYSWVDVGATGTNPGSARFGPGGIQKVCFAGVGCGKNSAPDDLPPIPPDPHEIWIPIVLPLLIAGFGASFYMYRRKKNMASRLQKAKIAQQEAELDGFRNSVVDMCTAEQQYVPKITETGRNSNGMVQVKSAQWCWRETVGFMDDWDDKDVEGNRADCWVKYDDAANQTLELAYQEQGQVGKCVPKAGYSVDFVSMIQTKVKTKFEREVKRVQVATQEQALDLGQIFVANGIPTKIAKEPQLVLVPGDIIQISNKRNDGWAYGSKLHMEDEPLGRRLVQLTLSKQDNVLASLLRRYNGDVNGGNNDDDQKYIVTYSHGWFPTNVTRVPNRDDLNTLRKTLGEGDDLSAPKHWDKIIDPSVVQKSKPLDKNSKEYQSVSKSFLSTLSPNFKIVRIIRIQNLALRQSYVVKRKTIIARDTSVTGASGMKRALARFERSWLWHGTDEVTVEKIIQQGFNRSFCGKNATVYGKGVYFARDASYSSSDTYSPKNSSGHKFILACNVVVGEFCLGKTDARTPDLRDAAKNILYDSTVDNMNNPSLYVTYHDAQATPEYLIVFKEGRRSTRK